MAAKVRFRSPAKSSRGVSAALSALFFLAAKAPWILWLIRPFAIVMTVVVAGSVRRATAANARRIFGRKLSFSERLSFALKVVGNFYDFVVDAGHSATASADDLAARISAGGVRFSR